MRVLGRVRLSRFTEESTSVERQQEIITKWAEVHEHEIIGWAIDVDVSRSVDPFKTPELGPWLTDPEKIHQWDIVACWKLDRVATGSIYLNKVLEWCKDRDHYLASVTESFDLSTWIGRMIANNIASVAEGELEAIRERTQGSQKKLRSSGRWHGGTVPYGYRAEKHEHKWFLKPDPQRAQIVSEVFKRVLARDSLRQIADDLNAREVPTSQGGKWRPTSLSHIIRSRSSIGQAEHDGSVVIDEDGMPLQRAEPLVPFSEWQRANELLNSKLPANTSKKDSGLLVGVLFCWSCGSPMYINKSPGRNGERYHYWLCHGRKLQRTDCREPGIPAKQLEDIAEEQFLDLLGDKQRVERIWVSADAQAEQLEQIEASIRRLKAESDAGVIEDENEYITRLKTLMTRKKELEPYKHAVSRWEERPLGETYGDAWKREDKQGRWRMLLDAGITMKARKLPFEFRIDVDQSKLDENYR